MVQRTTEPSITPATLVTVAPYLSLIEGLTARVESGKRFGEDTAEQRIYPKPCWSSWPEPRRKRVVRTSG